MNILYRGLPVTSIIYRILYTIDKTFYNGRIHSKIWQSKSTIGKRKLSSRNHKKKKKAKMTVIYVN